MATADTVRTPSRVSSDKSGSCSDDVVSLDSWSEKLDEWPAEFVVPDRGVESRSRVNTPRTASAMGYSHQQTGRHPAPTGPRMERSVALRSATRDVDPRARSRTEVPTVPSSSRTETVPTISGNLPPAMPSRHRRTSATSSESDSSPLHSPRYLNEQQTGPLSPSRRNPDAGSRYSDGHHFQFAQHLHPHYSSSPVHHRHSTALLPGQSGAAWQSDGALSSHARHHGHHGRGRGSHHRHFVGQYPHQIGSFRSGNNLSLDIEREGEKIKTKVKSIWNNMKYGK